MTLKKMCAIILVICCTLGLSACGITQHIVLLGSDSAPNYEVETLLYNALFDENLEGVKEAVALGADPNTVNMIPLKPTNALYYYSMEHMGIDSYGGRRGTEISEFLLQAGADPNAILNHDGMSLLMYTCNAMLATGAGVNTLFDQLLAHGADVTLTDKQGFSALDYAVRDVDNTKVKKLLEYDAAISNKTLDFLLSPDAIGIDIYDSAMTANTVLTAYASQPGGAEPSPDIQLCTLAVEKKSAQFSRMLSEQSGECCELAQILAIAFCSPDLVERIASLDPTRAAEYVRLAILTDNSDTARYLQEKYSVSPLDALQFSVEAGNESLVDQYLNSIEYRQLVSTAGAGNEAYNTLATLLKNACKNDSWEVVSALIEAGPEYTATTWYDAMTVAITEDNVSVIDGFCKSRKMDVNFRRSNNDYSFLSTAMLHGNPLIVNSLLKSGAIMHENESYLKDVASRGNTVLIKLCFQQNDYVGSKRPVEEAEALVEAIRIGSLDSVRALLDSGIDVNVKITYSGYTEDGTEKEMYIYPVHEAARNWSSGILKLLIENSANIQLKDSDGKLPIDWAVTSYNKAVLIEAVSTAEE